MTDKNSKKSLAARKLAGATQSAPVTSRRRILVVEEDSEVRLLYADALAGPDYHVDFAEDGLTGWDALQTTPYDLLITEHSVPKLTGIELVRKMRAAQMALPVVMAAGRLPVHELARNPSLQLAATLVKPVAVGILQDTVRSALRVYPERPAAGVK